MLYLRSTGYPKSRQQHDATIDKLESTDTTPIKPSIKVLLLRGIIIIIYLLLGALVFRALEFKGRDKFYWNKTLTAEKIRLQRTFNISMETLSNFEYLVHKRIHEVFTEHKDWDYYQSLYFASTVTTTIGYGHITPQTSSGRLFLIIFALIGIPLNILALASVGEHITVAIFYFLRYLNIKFFHKQKMKHINIKVMFVSVVLMLLMLFLGGMLYCSTEDWDYIDSIYYCFVAMATIGFGDLVPNRGRAPDTDGEKAIWFLRALFISIGLSLVSTVFTALSNAMEEINLLLGRGKYNDWDRLLADAKQKQSYLSTQSKTNQETKPTLLLLADRPLSNQSFTPRNSNAKETLLLLPNLPDNDTNSSKISASEDSSPMSCEENFHRYCDNSVPQVCSSHRPLERLSSTPFSPIERHYQHVYRNYSHPLNANCHRLRSSSGFERNTQTSYHDIEHAKYLRSQNFVPLHMRLSHNKQSTEHFDILSNQC